MLRQQTSPVGRPHPPASGINVRVLRRNRPGSPGKPGRRRVKSGAFGRSAAGVLEVIGVLGEQFRVLKSQFRTVVRAAGRVLRSHTGIPLLRITVPGDSDGAARRDPALRRPLRISAPIRLH